MPFFTFLFHLTHGGVELNVWHQVEVLCVGFEALPDINVVWEHSYLLRHWKVGHLCDSGGRSAASRLHHSWDGWVIRIVPHSSNALPLFNGHNGKASFQHGLAGHQSRPSCMPL